MPSTRSSTRKLQTRLTFTPLPSSSPAAVKYPIQIQEPAASVRYNDPSSPTKRRRLGHGIGNKVQSRISRVQPKSPSKDSGSALTVQSPTMGRYKKEKHSIGAPPTPIASSQTLNSATGLGISTTFPLRPDAYMLPVRCGS